MTPHLGSETGIKPTKPPPAPGVNPSDADKGMCPGGIPFLPDAAPDLACTHSPW